MNQPPLPSPVLRIAPAFLGGLRQLQGHPQAYLAVQDLNDIACLKPPALVG